MEQQLSSRWTFFYKFIVPVLTTGGMCFGAYWAWRNPGSDRGHAPDGMAAEHAWLLMLAAAALVAAVMWWTTASLKRVVLAGDELLVSNYRTEIRVPLTWIEKISGPSRTNPKRYTVTLVEPTDFGRRITFLPPMSWSLLLWTEPEEVGELRNAWAAARAASARR